MLPLQWACALPRLKLYHWSIFGRCAAHYIEKEKTISVSLELFMVSLAFSYDNIYLAFVSKISECQSLSWLRNLRAWPICTAGAQKVKRFVEIFVWKLLKSRFLQNIVALGCNNWMSTMPAPIRLISPGRISLC